LKETILLTIHKKGDITELSNYRGIMLTNTLMTLAISYEAVLLQEWADKLGLLPSFQIATRPSTQGRDITSFLALLESWSIRNNQTVYVLKKDQQKGFDFLSLWQAFYDAVQFYGLPKELIEFDKESQQDVPCRILTAHGLTETIRITGVNREGDNRAPIRFTLSMGMGSWYLHATIMQAEEGLPTSMLVKSMNSNSPHTPSDALQCRITSIEMMDDSLLFARSIPALRRINLIQEFFQFTYGAVTATGPDKTVVSLFNPPSEGLDQSTLVAQRVRSVKRNDDGEWKLDWEIMEVPITKQLTFLKTCINDQAQRYEELKSAISEFTIPSLPRKLPITVVHRIIAQLLIVTRNALIDSAS
jgi:hypothetical protein